MNCEYCGSDRPCKKGRVRGFQRYICKECKRMAQLSQLLDTLLKGGFRPCGFTLKILEYAIGRFLKVSHVTVWHC